MTSTPIVSSHVPLGYTAEVPEGTPVFLADPAPSTRQKLLMHRTSMATFKAFYLRQHVSSAQVYRSQLRHPRPKNPSLRRGGAPDQRHRSDARVQAPRKIDSSSTNIGFPASMGPDGQ